MKPIENTNIQMVAGSVIHWDKIESRKVYAAKCIAVPVTCGGCNKTRWVPVATIRNQTVCRNGKFTGLCRSCRPRLDPPRFRGGRHIDGYGYMKCHRLFFSSSDRVLLEPMFANNGYVREHRAVMALHLERSLRRNEIVHHKDGNRQNNTLGNLALLLSRGENSHGTEAHHPGHGHFYQEWQEALIVIARLEQDIERLKTQLSRCIGTQN